MKQKIKKTIKTICIFSFLTLTIGCGGVMNSCQRLGANARNASFKVTLYSGGEIVREWDVKGYISSESSTDGYFFVQNGKVVRITGDIVIEEK